MTGQQLSEAETQNEAPLIETIGANQAQLTLLQFAKETGGGAEACFCTYSSRFIYKV